MAELTPGAPGSRESTLGRAGPTVPGLPQVSAGRLSAKTLAAIIALWAVLSVLAEGEKTRGVAVGLAWTVALSSALLLGPKALANASTVLPKVGG